MPVHKKLSGAGLYHPQLELRVGDELLGAALVAAVDEDSGVGNVSDVAFFAGGGGGQVDELEEVVLGGGGGGGGIAAAAARALFSEGGGKTLFF